MKYITYLSVLIAALVLAGCASMKVSSEQLSEFDFARTLTYEWVEAPPEIRDGDDTYLNGNMYHALNDQLLMRGWQMAEPGGETDVTVVYYIKLEEHQEYASANGSGEPEVTGGFTYNKDAGGWSANEQQPDLNVYNVETGTLTLLIYNAHSGECVWNGTLITRIDRSTPLEKQNKKFREVADRIVRELP